MTAKNTEQTLVIIKPDGLKKSLTGNILSRLSETHLRIVGAKVVHVGRNLAGTHYINLKDKSYYNDAVNYLCGERYGNQYMRVLALIYKGKGAVKKVRKLAGVTNPENADPTTIRGQYGRLTSDGFYENVLHCSEDNENAEREIKLWFEPDEIVDKIYLTAMTEAKTKKRKWK